eukprot:1594506-Pyramimonas_sp.AAC.1
MFRHSPSWLPPQLPRSSLFPAHRPAGDHRTRTVRGLAKASRSPLLRRDPRSGEPLDVMAGQSAPAADA